MVRSIGLDIEQNGLKFMSSSCGAAPELVRAIRDLGWLPETVLARRWPRISKCECVIRTFEECCRCLHLHAGFAVLPQLWPITCRHAAVAISIDKWEKTFGTEFKGAS